MKLKTLKDMIQGTELGDAVNPYELKKEAIAWVKELRKEEVIDEAWEGKGKYIYFFDADGGEFTQIINWIIMFFNLMEDDLK